jgi:exopolysaccharide biosynthesis polyprenyl glycosylphosphotransferase
LSFLGLTGIRFVEKRYYDARRQAGYYLDRALVIGSSQGIQVLDQFIEAGGFSNDVRIVPCTMPAGMLRPEPGAPGPQPEAWFADLRSALRSQPINEVVLILNSRTETWLKEVAEICAELGQPLRIIPDSVLRYRLFTSSNLTVYPDSFIGLPALLLLRSRRKPGYEFVKRLMDLLVSGLLLILLAPLLAVIALAVKLSSPGPIFYRWGVLGQNNREFTGYKFRTMVADADRLKAQLLARNEMSGPVFKLKDDPRVTRVGRFLRKYSLDELPQLWSVLKGDMSLVGPRPPLKSEFDRFEFWHARKLSVRPGMTCLWQVSGRNEIRDFDEWVRLDLEYIDRRSLGLDLEILGRTALTVLRGTGR